MKESNSLLEQWPEPGVCQLVLNRPKAFNSLSTGLVEELRQSVAGCWEKGAKVLLITASEPGFCAGADLKQRKVMSDDEKYQHNRAINALANEIADLGIPTIAVINGVAMGGGLEISLACDIRYASTDAKIGLTEARIGAMPGAGGSQRLPRIINPAIALEMMFSGEPVTGSRAEAIGLVNRAFTPDTLQSEALNFAKLLASRSRQSTALLKKAVYQGLETTLEAGLELEHQAILDVIKSDDYKEGLLAFAEKRKPNFS